MATATPTTLHLLHSNHSLGYITGTTYLSPHNPSKAQCHLFAGLPYALPPVGAFRFRRPRQLPPCYRYGTQTNPGVFTGGAGICPQPLFAGGIHRAGDEDCLQVNVWVPGGEPPKGGWPVFFFIHGGWLQYGTPNSTNAVALLGETTFNCILICPAYRLNVFGFLASKELEEEGEGGSVGNYGFWDQRMALEWTRKFASYFGGNPKKITVGGYSAGAHSTFHQLAHDLYLQPKDQIIRRAVLFSNGPGMQPKALSTVQEQFDSLLAALSIPLSLPSTQKLAKLRSLASTDILTAIEQLDLHEFRAVTDGTFISPSLFEDIDSGIFAQKLKKANVRILIGECQNESFMYGAWRPPKTDTFAAMRKRLLADYSGKPLDAALAICCPSLSGGDRELPTLAGRTAETWIEAFGLVYADLQVHALERGFICKLHEHGAGDLIKRYRIEYRCRCIDGHVPLAWGVSHASDLAIWFWGSGMKVKGIKGEREEVVGLLSEEKIALEKWLNPFWAFLRFEGVDEKWGTEGAREVRRLKGNGSVDISRDEDWDRGVRVWEVTRAAAIGEQGKARL